LINLKYFSILFYLACLSVIRQCRRYLLIYIRHYDLIRKFENFDKFKLLGYLILFTIDNTMLQIKIIGNNFYIAQYVNYT